jgi:hypothetical protein
VHSLEHASDTVSSNCALMNTMSRRHTFIMKMTLEKSLSGKLFYGRIFFQESLGNFLGLLRILAEPEP